MAFYKLNRDAFPDNNLNSIARGTQLKIPSDAQMRAMPKNKAVQSVRKLSRPLNTAQAQKAKPLKPATKAPSLVVGGSGNTAQAGQAPTTTAQKAPPAVVSQTTQLSDLKGYDQLATIVTELGNFTQTIKQEISDSRDRDILFKEELIAARGENRVLTDRMGRLEAQLSRMSQLLELQSNALQALNSNVESSRQPVSTGLSLNQLEPADAVVPPATQPETSTVPKTYYEQLLDVAISDAPEEDKSYIEEVLNLSSTSIGLADTNPVTAEMEAKAAANKPAAPASPADPGTETMLENVRASLGASLGNQLSTAQNDTTAAPKAEVAIANQDLAYIEALNEEDRSQIEKSEARIAELEQELQAKIKAAQTAGLAASIANSGESNTAEPASSGPAAMAENEAETDSSFISSITGYVSSVTDMAKPALNSVSSILNNVSTDIWRLIGGLGAAIIGLMVILGFRRRKLDAETDEDILAINNPVIDDDSTHDVAELAAKSMEHEPEEVDLEEELHGSSLFDLSDESFMASEAIQDDSSLFSMDDNDDFDSLTDMDSAQVGQPSTLTQSVEVDPIAEADVYLAYDRKEQAIEVLEQSLSKDPNQSTVVIKLLSLYQAGENTEGFTKLFESSAEHIEDDDDWNQIKLMAQEFVPGHEMLADDFDSSIPVLMDEVMTEEVETNTLSMDDMPDDEVALSMGDEDDDFPELLDIDEPESKAESKTETKAGLKLDTGEKPEPESRLTEMDESLNISLDTEKGDTELEEELDSAMEEVNQHEPDTALALAKAYIELGEADIAKDFLLDVISSGGDELKSEAEEMLASLG